MASANLNQLRRFLVSHGFLPLSKLARFTLYLLGVDLLLSMVDSIEGTLRHTSATWFGGLVTFLTFVASILLFILFVRWFRRKLMWRLRNRLIVTYTFIGVIPVVLLLVMGLIITYLFIGQFATYVASSDLQAELKSLEAVNSRLASEVAIAVRSGHPLSAEMISKSQAHEDMFPNNELTVWLGDKPFVLHTTVEENGAKVTQQAEVTPVSLPKVGGNEFGTIAVDNGKLSLRAVRVLMVDKQRLVVISSVPLDQALLSKVANGLGIIALRPFSTGPNGRETNSSLTVSGSDSDQVIDFGPQIQGTVAQGISGGKLPPQQFQFDREVNFPATAALQDWQTGADRNLFILVTTRPSLLYDRLFRTVGMFARAVMVVLAAIAIFFGLIELVALIVGVRLTRTITRSVAALYTATQHINRGDFAHRIKVKSDDQLASLERSFNGMTESLQKLMREQKEKQRLENELSIAQEVQAQLFPKQTSELETLELYGVCKPARTVSGDYYDYVPLGSNRLAIAVGDISGKGISAALMMATIHSAVRAYSLERTPSLAAASVGNGVHLMTNYEGPAFAAGDSDISPAQLCAMLNRQVYHSTPPEKYATMFLGIYDGTTRKFGYSNAGHLPPLLIGRNESIRRLECGGSVIGLFDGLTYAEGEVELQPGDTIVFYSDGITEPENEFGEFGEDRLAQIIKENFSFPLHHISDQVLSAVSDWIGANEQPDDETLVLARVR
jgi:sigma-B regulation protein RsbU (phosphoserine phosphatase)